MGQTVIIKEPMQYLFKSPMTFKVPATWKPGTTVRCIDASEIKRDKDGAVTCLSWMMATSYDMPIPDDSEPGQLVRQFRSEEYKVPPNCCITFCAQATSTAACMDRISKGPCKGIACILNPFCQASCCCLGCCCSFTKKCLGCHFKWCLCHLCAPCGCLAACEMLFLPGFGFCPGPLGTPSSACWGPC